MSRQEVRRAVKYDQSKKMPATTVEGNLKAFADYVRVGNLIPNTLIVCATDTMLEQLGKAQIVRIDTVHDMDTSKAHLTTLHIDVGSVPFGALRAAHHSKTAETYVEILKMVL